MPLCRQEATNMTRINLFRTIAFRTIAPTRSFATWDKNTSALVFAAVLVVCSVTVGCSSDKPKPVSTNSQIPVAQPQGTLPPAPAPAPITQATTKPAPKKVASKRPATVNYTDKTYGLTFEYPRRYAIETGSAAIDLVASNPIPMNFVQTGGIALAAVELPETSFANTDFSSAFFNVSVNKALTADQCTEFAVPQPKIATPAPSPESASTTPPASAASAPSTEAQPASNSKLMLGDLELRATEAVAGEGSRQSDSKYFHVFQNGTCYEFALNVTTVASGDGITKHVDRDRVFDRLEKILATVKINPVVAPEVTAEAPTPAVTPEQ
jgi:hypothetical protein